MNTDFTKYLSEVFRNDGKVKADLESDKHQYGTKHLNDPRLNQFVLDGKYTYRLDELI